MKIYTITCHDVYNHGASLQAYALMKYLEGENNDVMIIDYKPEYLSQHYNFKKVDNPKYERNIFIKYLYLLAKLPQRILSLKRKKSFDKFRGKYLKLTPKKYVNNEELKLNLPPVDAYICGSDQIWNSLHKNGRDMAFYLNFVPNKKIKLSYAASFATDSIQDKYKSLVYNNIRFFDGIAIREKSGVKIVKSLGIQSAVNVVDPVFLLSQDEWNQIAQGDFKDKYILVYDSDNSKLIENIAKSISKKFGYKIYSIDSSKNKYADKNFMYDGPETFVSLIKNSEFVVANSFHALAFSVIYEKQFAIVNRTEAINTRMRDFLEDLELKNRLIGSNYNSKQLYEKINYESVNKLLDEKVGFSKNYLNQTLNVKK